jgi:hypothetical protein
MLLFTFVVCATAVLSCTIVLMFYKKWSSRTRRRVGSVILLVSTVTMVVSIVCLCQGVLRSSGGWLLLSGFFDFYAGFRCTPPEGPEKVLNN